MMSKSEFNVAFPFIRDPKIMIVLGLYSLSICGNNVFLKSLVNLLSFQYVFKHILLYSIIENVKYYRK